MAKFEWTAFKEADLLKDGDANLGYGDTFKMPGQSTVTMSTYDDDGNLSGDDDYWHNDRSIDTYGQDAYVDGARVGCKVYAEQYYTLHGSDGKTYYLIEIEVEGYDAPGVGEDFFSFYGQVPPEGVTLTVQSCHDVAGCYIDYTCLSAGASAPANTPPTFTNVPANGCLTIDENTKFVIDLDSSDAEGDAVSYSITGGADAHLFVIDPDTGELSFKNAPDYENPQDAANCDGIYDVQVTVTDSAGGTDTKCLCVKVQDVAEDNAVIKGRFTTDADGNDSEWNAQTNSWDAGIEGATIELLDSDGNVVATTQTDAYGNYTFDGLAAGSYRVKFPAQDQKIFSEQNKAGVGEGEDSDANEYGITDAITLSEGQCVLNVDAGVKDNVIKVCQIIEAEDMHLCGFTVKSDGSASGHESVASGHDGYADSASFTFQGEDGTCDLTVRAFDGKGDHSYHWFYGHQYNPNTEKVWVYVNNQLVKGPIHLNQDNDQWTDITLKDLHLCKGDQITIYASGDNCKPAMIDYVKICCEVKDPMTGKIGDTVWLDSDKDGIQDAGEAGVAGVQVLLKNAAGVVIATTITDADGKYLFDNLAAGDYSVTFVPASDSGLIFTQANAGGNDAQDSDADTTTGMTGTITLEVGEADLTVDAGLVDPGTAAIKGTYFCDEDFSATETTGDKPVADVTVELLDAAGNVIATTKTDANGDYAFTGLDAGDYKVRFADSGEGKAFVAQNAGNDDTIDSDVDSTGTTGTITVGVGETSENNDAGIEFTTGSLSGTYFCDDNNNGVQDATDPGIAGVTVILYDAAGQMVASTTTDANGDYSFSGLAPATYSVKFQDRTNSGKTLVEQNVGNDDTIDSDAVFVGESAAGYFSKITDIVVEAGQNNGDNDAGVEQVPPGSIAGRVFCDENNNDVDDNEPGVANVTVRLLDASGAVVATTVTDATGAYKFENLTPGDYKVDFDETDADLGGKTLVDQDQGNDDTIDSDAGTDGTTDTITVDRGEDVTDVDAGVEDPGTASVGDTVWLDADKDGQRDAGEAGVEGVSVTLTGAGDDGVFGTTDDITKTTTTDANGNYLFENLDEGDYKVTFGTKGDLVFTTASAAAADAANDDSDANTANGMTGTFNLSIGEAERNIDAGLVDPGTAAIKGTYFCDEDFSDTETTGDKPVADVTVELLDAAGNVIATTKTDANGDYEFTGLDAGDYKVRFADSNTGKTFVAQNAGNDDTIDSDVNGNGKTGTITVAIGETSENNDAGIADPKTASLSGRFFCDEDKTDTDTAGDKAVAGATVILLKGGVQVATTTTDANGDYTFTGLAAGTDYSVRFVNTSDKVFVAQDQGGDDTIDSDVDSTGTTGTVTVVLGQETKDVDAGIVDPGTAKLGDRLWNDTNRNGIQDAGEAGVANATVTLTGAGKDGVFGTADDISKTTTTDANGNYLFDNLDAGDYYVDFAQQAGFDFTSQNTGGDDAADSDVNAAGRSDTVTLAIGDANLTVDAGIVRQNTAPAPQDDMGKGCADKAIAVDVLANDTDADGDTLTVTAVNGQAISEGQTISIDGVNITLTGGTLSFDGISKYADLEIGQHADVQYSYTVSDGTATATANVDTTFCGTLNTINTVAAQLPSTAKFGVGGFFVGDAYSAFVIESGDTRIDGKLIEQAYCIERNADIVFNKVDFTAQISIGIDGVNAPGTFTSNVEGNFDLINWILNQDFTSKDNGDGNGRNYTDTEIQSAIWGLTDGDFSVEDPGTVNGVWNGTSANAKEIMDLAIANGEGFTPGAGDLFAVVINPDEDQSAAGYNEGNDFDQAFIVALQFNDFTQDCLC